MSRPLLRGRLKANAVGLYRLYHSPSTRKDNHPAFPMKAIPLVLVAVMGISASVRSQEPVAEAPANGSIAAPAIASPARPGFMPPIVSPSGRTLIPHPLEVPPFTPPPPPVVKRLPAVRVDSAVTVLSKDAHTLSLQRGEPSTEPDLPPPTPPPPYVEPHEPTAEEKAQRIWQHRHNLNLEATVYDHAISVVNWTDQESLVQYEAVCGFDIGLLAGVGDFVHKGEEYRLFLMHSDFNTAAVRRLASQWDLPIPDVAQDEILITRGDRNAAAATAPITVVKEIIAVEKPRLYRFQAARTAFFKASAAWYAAHPPIPHDETFILRPHRGSRYLPAAKPTEPVQP